MSAITGDWLEALKGEFHQPYYAKLYKTIAKALNALVEKKTDDGKKDDGNKGDNKKDDTKVDDNKNNNSSNTSKSDNKTTTKVDNTKKAAKTGDTTNVAVWAFALAASAAAAGVVVKRKKEN